MEKSRQINTEDQDANMGQQLISKYLPYWPLFILFALLALIAAYVYLRYATPIYQASATLIIKDESRGAGEDKFTQSLNLIESKKNIENEMQVLQSRELMEKVVKALYLYAPITQEGKIKSGDAYTLSPILIEAKSPDSIKSAIKINFTYNKSNQTVTLNNTTKYPIGQFVNTPYGILKFIPNRYSTGAAHDPNKQLYFSLDDVKFTASDYLGNLKIVPNKQSAIVEIVYKDPIPQRAVDIINNLITIYDQVSITEKNASARNSLAFVNQQLSGLAHELDSIERKVERYKSGRGAVDISTQGSYILKNMSDNEQKLGEVNMKLSMLNQVERSVANKQTGEMLAPSTSGLDPNISAMLGQLQTKQMEYESLKKTVGENNPALLALGDQINKLQPTILENIQNTKQGLAASRQSIAASSGSYGAQLSAVPQKEKELLEISREHMTKANQYQSLLQRKQEAEMTIESVQSNSRIVDSALAGNFPVSPNKKLIYIIAVIGAVGLCIGLITIKDSFTGKIRYRNEIEKMTSIPIIGEIAFDTTKTPLVIEKGTRSFVAEEFRKLRISLSFLGIDPSHKKLLLTSSISGEGKSFIAANLAVSLSLTGKKVVLVDLDLNNPTLAKILNVNYEDGITEFLNGEKKADEIVYKLDTHENLYFIPAGNLPENPTELLANGKVNSLINYLENNFDMVLIDTSPAVLVTDAYILSGMCDATLYVIRHNYTPKILIKRIDVSNQINPINNPAIVFNGVKMRGVFKNNYGYGYDYVYGNKDRGSKTKKAS